MALYFPPMQLSQVMVSLESAKYPAAHLEQLFASSSEKKPTGQTMHDAEPVDFAYLPLRQEEQTVDAGSRAYRPMGHEVQEGERVVDVRPDAQFEQGWGTRPSEKTLGWYFPAGQLNGKERENKKDERKNEL